MIILIALVFGCFLAYANGSNDNFKGVATLYGSGTLPYRKALFWGTITTFAGSLTATILAGGLIAKFSGKGLVPDDVMALHSFSLAVGLAAALTVMLATVIGFPISTTHALVGALAGAGTIASATGVNFSVLGSGFFMPLILSPLAAVAGTVALYPAARFIGGMTGIKKETCLCVGNEVVSVVPAGSTPDAALKVIQTGMFPTAVVSTEAVCVERFQGNLLGVSVHSIMNNLHYLSAGAVGFARGLNDTPKIAALLLVASAFSPWAAIVIVTMLMAVGGVINARKVADKISKDVTAMDEGQGLSANLVTSVLVLFASKWGLPVSTTHVSCGALFGIGAVTRKGKIKTILAILTAWVTTLPAAALLGAVFFVIFKKSGV